MSSLEHQARALLVQQHQLSAGQKRLDELNTALDGVMAVQADNAEQLAAMLEHAELVLAESTIVFEVEEEDAFLVETSLLIAKEELPPVLEISPLDFVAPLDGVNWGASLAQFDAYAERHSLSSSDPFRSLMSTSQRMSLDRRIKEEFSLKGANCDKYDYMIAATCGLIGGLVDILFLGAPGEGGLTRMADGMADKAVETFASWNGWKGPREGSDPTASAIGFLERNYKVNYDHRYTPDVGKLFPMSTKNHHIKSLAHSPDLVGLFFSLLDQFTSTAHFVDSGRLISIDTETFDLRGGNLVAKLFAGFANWLGHLVSDVAGSSGASGRGSGIPIPFYSLLQFINVGEFGQHRQSFAKICVQVFEQGYDFRHGIALSIPVIVTELLTRAAWTFKQGFVHNRPWGECLPLSDAPELRRMLLIGHGCLCLVDGADAALRSGGEIIQFMLRSNLLAWARFGTLAMKELKAWYGEGALDDEAVDAYLDAEYRRLLSM